MLINFYNTYLYIVYNYNTKRRHNSKGNKNTIEKKTEIPVFLSGTAHVGKFISVQCVLNNEFQRNGNNRSATPYMSVRTREKYTACARSHREAAHNKW